MKRIAILTIALVMLTAGARLSHAYGQTTTNTAHSSLTAAQKAALQAQQQELLSLIMPPTPSTVPALTRRIHSAMSLQSASPAYNQPMDQPYSPPAYAIVDLGTLGGGSSHAYAINDKGQVAGWANTSGSSFKYGVVWSPSGVIQNLNNSAIGNQIWTLEEANVINNFGQAAGYGVLTSNLNGNLENLVDENNLIQDFGLKNGSGALSISDSGQVAGNIETNGTFLAFEYSNGSTHSIGTLGGSESTAKGINNSGEIVGYSYTSGNVQRSFLYMNGVMQDIGTLGGSTSFANAVNDSGQITGTSYIADNVNQHAYLYVNGSMQDLGTLGGSFSTGICIDGNGDVVGQSYTANDAANDLFMWSNGSIQDLGNLNGIATPIAVNNSGVIIGSGAGSDYFVCSGGVIQNITNVIVPANFGWTGLQLTAINNAGQIVGVGVNPSGQSHAFLLNPLPAGSPLACTVPQTSLPNYGEYPTPEAGKDGLVVITHGWINPDIETEAQGMAYVDSMSNSIVQTLANSGVEDWQVFGFKWGDKAYVPIFPDRGPAKALDNALQEGTLLGDAIVQGGWTRVHLIAHSAGAGLIQKAAEEIKATSKVPVTIQCTFLDAYDGVLLEYVPEYGYKADWSDSYFSRDLLTGEATQQPLENAYNVDVTTLDPQATQEQITGYVSGGDLNTTCYKTESTHGWPVTFYSNTIPPNVFANYAGFGFPLSQEGGGWGYATNNYHPGNGTYVNSEPITILGSEDPSCVLDILPPSYMGSGTSFSASSTTESLTGTIQTWINSLNLITGSPVWIGTVITDTNALNYLSFDAEFTSVEGAHGLLSVYWDTNMIGLVDEAAVPSGTQHYTLPFPNTIADTSHILGFHMDPFTSTHSSIAITNIAIGLAGVSLSPLLSVTTNTNNGMLVFQLTGEPDNYTVEAATNLTSTNWANIAILANTTGTVKFVDPEATNYPCRFYRAVAQ